MSIQRIHSGWNQKGKKRQISQIAREWILASNKKNLKCKECGLRYHDYDASHCKHCGTIIYQEVDGV